jgi:hypothetical protein
MAMVAAPDFFLVGAGVVELGAVVVVAFAAVAFVASDLKTWFSAALTVGVKVMATAATRARASERDCMAIVLNAKV